MQESRGKTIQESHGDEVTSQHNEDPGKTKKNMQELLLNKTMQESNGDEVTSVHNEDPGKTKKKQCRNCYLKNNACFASRWGHFIT